VRRIDHEKTGHELFEERQKRINDAIELRVPDRVPVYCPMGYFPAKYIGIPFSAAYYDFDAWYDAYKRTLQDFRADEIFVQPFTPGKALEILEPKQMRWPGYGLGSQYSHQSVEINSMQANELDMYIDDASDFLLRLHLSRLSDHLIGLSKMLPLWFMGQGPVPEQVVADVLAKPEVARAIRTLQKAGREMRKWRSKQAKFQKLLADMGYGQNYGGAILPPYDIISHSLRGMTGTMCDMYRQPDKLIELCEHILKISLQRMPFIPDEKGRIRVFMTNTRGSDEFLSKKQFDTFYWPTFKKLVLALVERGATPCIFFEGNFTSRLEYLLEFPKGKVRARFDTTDIFRAKDILKGHMCIEGNVPSSLLQVGSTDDIKDYCKKLIDKVGKDGGYILSARSSLDEVNPANLKTMIDFTREYGVYR
jgi:hypothetical protein